MSGALFKHPGGKRRLAKFIVPLIPKHVCYVEPFCGAAAILFAKERSKVEVLNDKSEEIVNAFRCARHHNEELVKELSLRINSRKEFNVARKRECECREQRTDIQKAADFLFCKATSFGADADSFGVMRSSGGGAATSMARAGAALKEAWARIDGVILEHLEWERCIELYDSEGTFFFCDPPYIGGGQRCYASWTLEDLGRLARVLQGIKGKWLLTINDSPAVRKLLAGFRLQGVDRARGIDNKGGPSKRYAELIVTPKINE